MITTNELIEKYLISIYPDAELCEYDLNGSIIKIRYSRPHSFSEGRSYDNYTEVELLEYITFVFNKRK